VLLLETRQNYVHIKDCTIQMRHILEACLPHRRLYISNETYTGTPLSPVPATGSALKKDQQGGVSTPIRRTTTVENLGGARAIITVWALHLLTMAPTRLLQVYGLHGGPCRSTTMPALWVNTVPVAAPISFLASRRLCLP